ncbi:folylpolyglutamate synthase, partial [Tanacetum coccineum]
FDMELNLLTDDYVVSKAGIFKPQIPEFTIPQLPKEIDVLKQRAQELEVPLQVVEPLAYRRLNDVNLSLSGDHQLVNVGLAVSSYKSWLNTTRNWEKLLQNNIADNSLPEAFLRGLSCAHLSRRAQIFHDINLGLSDET